MTEEIQVGDLVRPCSYETIKLFGTRSVLVIREKTQRHFFMDTWHSIRHLTVITGSEEFSYPDFNFKKVPE